MFTLGEGEGSHERSVYASGFFAGLLGEQCYETEIQIGGIMKPQKLFRTVLHAYVK
jgi:hypothetical protein